MGTITKKTDSMFKTGDVVVVADTGQTYSTYREMAVYLGLKEYRHGQSPLRKGDKVTVISSANHESICYGEVVAVRTASGQDALIGATGLKLPEVELDEDGKKILQGYERAMVVQYHDALKAAADRAPEWALYVGQDGCGIHYFDHHPYVYTETSLLKGLLPESHRVKMSHSYNEGGPVVAMRIKPSHVQIETITELRRELAEVRAKLWEAERKLSRALAVLA